MDEMFVNIMSKDLHEIREDMGRQTGVISEIKTAMTKVEVMDRTANSLLKSLETSSLDVGRLSQEIRGVRGLVAQLRHDLAKPLQQEHHHHFPKILWAAFALLIGFSVAVGGWFQSSRAGKEYRDADTQIRYLRLLPEDSLYSALMRAEKLVKSDPENVRDSVLQVEEDRERYWQMVREAERLRKKGYGR
ncbi:hypothetical protein MKQ70_22185 [Chitinophaga sedimenti]|uniref:hypothetical protein n=1 Tax=Chitinophaga sedimenti TaxID=2033606 RepID=UPI002002F53E|nr:hypothetical protein [Chitinophaga sedimenti]MCK7557563.1 hypothetical protein [Chitinophaga sedimenti]